MSDPLQLPARGPTGERFSDLFGDITTNDLQRSWFYVTKHRDTLFNGRRIEYVSWRRWFQQKFQLPTLKPEELNWARDPNECWLYGPIPSAADTNVVPNLVKAAAGPGAPAGMTVSLSPYLEQLNLIDSRFETPTCPHPANRRHSVRSPLRREPTPVLGGGKFHVEHIVAPMAPIAPPTATFESSPGPSSPTAITSPVLRHHNHGHGHSSSLRKSKSTRDLASASHVKRANRAAARAQMKQATASVHAGAPAPRRVHSDVTAAVPAPVLLSGKRTRFHSDEARDPPFFLVGEDDSGDENVPHEGPWKMSLDGESSDTDSRVPDVSPHRSVIADDVVPTVHSPTPIMGEIAATDEEALR